MPPSPLDWVRRLAATLEKQRAHGELYDEHYSGERELALVKRDYLEVFGGRADSAVKPDLDPPRTNVCAVGVNAVAERLVVDGFEVGPSAQGQDGQGGVAAGGEGAAATQPNAGVAAADEIARRNELDVMAPIGHVEALVKGAAFIIVGADAENRAVVTVEDASQVVVARQQVPPYDVAAALKVYVDDWTGATHATLWLPEGIYRFRRGGSEVTALWIPGESMSAWIPREGPDGAAEERAPEQLAGRVPVVELANRARLIRPPSSDLVDVAPLADAHSKLLADLVIAASFGAIPIRTATGIKIPVDPVTGQRVAPIDVRADRLLVSENEEARFGLLEAGQLAGYVAALDTLLRDVRIITRVPQHYYGGGTSSGLSGETLRAAEASMVRKVVGLQPRFGAGWRKAMSLALALEGGPYASAPVTTRWADTETRVEAQQVDAAQKLTDMGVPLQIVLERIGFPRPLIERALALQGGEAARAQQLLEGLERTVTGAPAPTLDTPAAEPVDV